MKIEAGMDIGQVQERIGSTASYEEAVAMVEFFESVRIQLKEEGMNTKMREAFIKAAVKKDAKGQLLPTCVFNGIIKGSGERKPKRPK